MKPNKTVILVFIITIIIEIIKKNSKYKYTFIVRKNKSIKNEKRLNNNLRLIILILSKKIIKFVIIMILILEISSKIFYRENFIFNYSEIILKIYETGMNDIINNKYINKEYPYPSLIYLNNKIQNLTNSTKIKIVKPRSVIKLVWNNPLKSINCLFCNCSNISEINFLNFDTSLLTDMSHLFENCYSLTSVNISNLNTKNVKLIRNMFYNCLNLTSIDLSNFDISKVKNMDKLFYNCKNLKYINLLNFTDKKSPTTKDIFFGIMKDAEINIDKNKAPSLYNLVKNISYLIIPRKLEYISYTWTNITENFFTQDNSQSEINGTEKYIIELNKTTITNENSTFYSDLELNDTILRTENYKECYITCSVCKEEGNYTKHNCESCSANYSFGTEIDGLLNCYNTCEYYTYNKRNNNKKYCTSDYSCPKNFNKLIPINNQCIDNCYKDNVYRYEFNHTCFRECPYNISKISKKKNNYCEVICPKELPFEIVETQSCVSNCYIIQRVTGRCIINYIPDDVNNKEVEEKEVENIKDELTKGFNTSDVDKGTNMIIEQKDSTVTISTTENQKNEKSSNLTTINLGECETKIKNEYNISENKSLYILKIDVKQEGLKIPKIVYEVYYPLFGDNLIKLNLTVCKDSKIEVSIPVVLTDDVDKINPSSKYYNDICYSYTSEDGTDITLSDRKNNFMDKNLTICEDDCYFKEYKDGKAICSCEAKTNSTTKIGDIVFDRNKLFDSFTNFKNIANINVLKCYQLIFNLDAYKYNYGNLIMIVIIIFLLIIFFIFYFNDYYYLKKILDIIAFFKLNLDR